MFAHKLYLAAESPWSSTVINQFLAKPIARAQLNGWLGKHPSKRLGTYFEQLIHYYLERCEQVQDVTRGVALRDNKQTLGELDFVYQLRQHNSYTHLEVAIKFYLAMGDPLNADNWLGLNPTDTLGNKVNRLLTHQLPVASTQTAAAVLQRLAIYIEHSEALIKGRLFYPWADFEQFNFNYPEGIAAEHLKGWWSRLSELHQVQDEQNQLYPLAKNYWMAKLSEHDLNRIQPLAQDRFELIYPLMVARVNRQGRELDRGVIIPDHWPRKARL